MASWIQPSFDSCLGPPRKRQKLSSEPSDVVNQVVKDLLEDEGQGEHTPGSHTSSASWLELIKPKSKDELLVHKKKVEEVEHWLCTTFKNHGSKILLVTGPPGSGKLRTLTTLCKSMRIEFTEWITPPTPIFEEDTLIPYTNQQKQFEEFIIRASRYSSVMSSNSSSRVAIVKDVPPVFLKDTIGFHELLRKYSKIENVRLIFILTEQDVIRTLFPDHLKSEAKITTINFNPFTVKALTAALTNLSNKLSKTLWDSQVIDEVAQSCTGDLRNAVNTLHFRLALGGKGEPTAKPKKKRGKTTSLNKDTRNKAFDGDNPVDLFHGVGRVLYAKRDDQGNLVHDPTEVASSFLDCSSMFVSMLQENYLKTFSTISSVAESANHLATADYLLHDFNLPREYGVSSAAFGLMVTNTNPIKRFQQFLGSSSYKNDNLLAKHKALIKQTFPIDSETDVLIDALTFMKLIPQSRKIIQSTPLKELTF